MPIPRAVIFDLDDTLYPEQTYVLSGFRAVTAWVEVQMGIPADRTFSELCQLFNIGVRGNIFNLWLKDHGLDPDYWILQMVQVYREHEPQIVPYPDVPELLQHLHQHYYLGLITDGYLTVQQKKLASLGLSSYFDGLVFSDELGLEAWKPNPLPFEVILGKLAITAREAVYVGDNPNKDFLGARQVGMWTVRVRHPEGLYSHLDPPSLEYAPDSEIKNLGCLEEILVRIGEHT